MDRLRSLDWAAKEYNSKITQIEEHRIEAIDVFTYRHSDYDGEPKFSLFIAELETDEAKLSIGKVRLTIYRKAVTLEDIYTYRRDLPSSVMFDSERMVSNFVSFARVIDFICPGTVESISDIKESKSFTKAAQYLRDSYEIYKDRLNHSGYTNIYNMALTTYIITSYLPELGDWW